MLMAKILVIDDDRVMRDTLTRLARGGDEFAGYFFNRGLRRLRSTSQRGSVFFIAFHMGSACQSWISCAGYFSSSHLRWKEQTAAVQTFFMNQ